MGVSACKTAHKAMIEFLQNTTVSRHSLLLRKFQVCRSPKTTIVHAMTFVNSFVVMVTVIESHVCVQDTRTQVLARIHVLMSPNLL